MRLPRAKARHLRSRAASEIRPAGTMTGLRVDRWAGTEDGGQYPPVIASQEARPELRCGVGSLHQVPRWNADRRRVPIWARRLDYASVGVPPSFFFFVLRRVG